MLPYDISLWNTKKALYLWELLLKNINFQMCQWLDLWSVPLRYLSISCYNDVVFNFYYFIAVHIEKTCSKSLMRFNNPIFYLLPFLHIADFNQVFAMVWSLNLQHWNRFLTNIVNEAYTFFILWKWYQERDQNINRNEF